MLIAAGRCSASVCVGLGFLLIATAGASATAADPYGCAALNASGAFNTVTLKSGDIELRFIPYGGTVTNIFVKDRNGATKDIVLGFDDPTQYCAFAQHPYFGALIGRVANRISNGTFVLDGVRAYTPINELPGNDTLHGGTIGFDRRQWSVSQTDASHAVLTLTSPDGEMGFPGDLDMITVKYGLEGSTWTIDYEATSGSSDSVCSLTQHTYWNLNGGVGDVLDHVLEMKSATRVLEVTSFLLPTGAFVNVSAQRPLDFTQAKSVGRDINATLAFSWGHGYDFAWVFDNWIAGKQVPQLNVFSPATGISLEMATDQISAQVYSGNFLNGSIPAKAGQGGSYPHWGALALEAQALPDAVNHVNFPSVIVKAGQTYRQSTSYTISSRA